MRPTPVRPASVRTLLARLARHRRASAAIEFAILAPFMLLLAGGVVELGALLRAFAAVNRLTMQYAVSYADCPDVSNGACQTELPNYTASAALANIAPQLTPALLSISIAQVTMNGTSPTISYIYPTSSALNASETAALRASIPSGQTGIVVFTSYQYSLLFFSQLMGPIIGSSFTISYNVAQLKS